MRRPRARLLLGLGIPVLLLVVLLAAWAIDSSSASGTVPRNVSLAGRDVSKLPEDRLEDTVRDVADAYAGAEIQIRTDDRTYRKPAAELGLRLDRTATTRDALDLEDEAPLAARPFVWLASFLDERTAPLTFTVDEDTLRKGLGELGGNAEASEPSLVLGPSGFAITSGSDGRRISAEGVAAQLRRRAESGEQPIIVDAEVVDERPSVSDEAARAVAERLNAGTANGLEVVAGEARHRFSAQEVRSWLGAEVRDGAMVPTIDPQAAGAALSGSLEVDAAPRDASFTVEGGAVRIVPSQDGRTCCAGGTAVRLLQAVEQGAGAVRVELQVSPPAFTTEDAQALGIKEPIGTTVDWKGRPQVRSFTTYFQPGQPRVTNIHRIADAVRGTVVRPGETFSMNEVAGQRTAAKGYVAAGAIANGEHVEEIGGGVSQFATTMFNAVFFAGLDFEIYQAHSEHFDRYPFGREATMGYPAPDLAWKNDTPHGILVWTSYTDTSVTVTLYSTQTKWAEQTGQSTGRSGRCTTVTTERTIHLPDGSTTTDTVGARYRDPGATSC